MKYLICLLFFKCTHCKASDSIPAEIKRFILKNRFAIGIESQSNQFSIYKFSDYNHKGKITIDSLIFESNIIIDSLINYLHYDSTYIFFIDHVNKSFPFFSSFCIAYRITNKKKEFVTISDEGEVGNVKITGLTETQFIDIRIGYSDEDTYKCDLILYNLIDDTTKIDEALFYKNAKSILLAFLGKRMNYNPFRIHIAFIGRLGMRVISSYCYPIYDQQNPFDIYNRSLKKEPPLQIYDK